MDSVSAFMRGQATKDCEPMIFDWIRAAQLIRESGALRAEAGLAGDWEWTGGAIYMDGRPVPPDETYVYLGSTWATPLLRIDDNEYECYRMQSETPGWGPETYWPTEAAEALQESTGE